VLRSIPTCVKVEDNSPWSRRIDKGILKWLIARGINVTSWEYRNIREQQLMAIANGLPMLQILNISSRENITDKGVIALANGNLTRLTTLFMTQKCHKITDAGVIALANGNLTSLTSLNIAECDHITDTGVDTVRRRLPDLDIIR
jgi:hypothetical protein